MSFGVRDRAEMEECRVKVGCWHVDNVLEVFRARRPITIRHTSAGDFFEITKSRKALTTCLLCHLAISEPNWRVRLLRIKPGLLCMVPGY